MFSMQLGLQVEKMLERMFEQIGYKRADLEGEKLFSLVPLDVIERNQQARIANGKAPMNWERHKYNDVAVLDHFYKIDFAFKVGKALIGLQYTLNPNKVSKKLDVLTHIHKTGLHRKAGFECVALVLVTPGPKTIEGTAFLDEDDYSLIRDRLFDLIDGVCDAQEAGRPLPTLMLVLP